jgi:hypothetical protein
VGIQPRIKYGVSLPPTRAFEGRFQQGTILNPGFLLPDQVEDKLRRNDNMEIGFEF